MTNLIELIEYNIWANKRILSQLTRIAHEDFIKDTHGCFPSLRHAIIHLLRSDWIWLGRWEGDDFKEMPDHWNELMIEAIESIWSGVQSNTLKLLRSSFRCRSDEAITISNGSQAKLTLTYPQTVDVVVNHGAHHRGQIANMIESIGLEPVKTQLLDYYLRRHI